MIHDLHYFNRIKMAYNIILRILLLFLPFFASSQQLIWVHRPFTESNVPNWQYNRDTASFNATSQIIGLVYHPNANKEQPQLELTVENELGKKNTATFHLKKADPSQLNWHPCIQKWQRYLLNNKHWYYFEITPNPMVVNAYDGVDFLDIIYQTAQENNIATFTYNVSGKYKTNTCTINFRQEQGLFATLWLKLMNYQTLIQRKKNLKKQQIALIKQCQPYGFDQVQKWASQASGLKKNLTTSDLAIFKAVENLKIITEAIPKSVSPYLKRKLRALLLLDIAILELPESNDKAKKIQQKEDLIKQLSLYPELQSTLNFYMQSTGIATSYKKTERQQQQELQNIIKKYRPYQPIYVTHQKLDQELKTLNVSLAEFD